MITPSPQIWRPFTRLAVVALTASACGGAEAPCLALPCPQPLALEITVTDGVSGAAAAGASIAVTGPVTGGGPCADGVCDVMGTAGTYDVDVSAPGYQTVHRRVVVPGATPTCGCPSVDTQRLTVALPAAG